jgi:RNA polymerase sigma factor (sigma-70 family)
MYKPAEAENERGPGLSEPQFVSARLGFFQLLRRRRMSEWFISRHGEDLFGQACLEYSRQRAEGKEIFDPPAWIVTCGWNRTKSLLEARDYRPEMVSTDLFGEFPAEGGTPEDDLLVQDRHRKIRDAVDQLPLYQRRLLALSYFEEESVREAARQLGWTASKAQRAHERAQRRMHKLLGVEDPEELEIIGLAAFLSGVGGGAAGRARIGGAPESLVRHTAHLGERALALVHRPFEAAAHPTRLLGRSAATAVEKTGEFGRRGPLRRVGELGRRLLAGGVGEAGTAAAGEGGLRALEICKGLTVCVIGGGALTGALVGGGNHPARPVEPTPRHHERFVRAEPARASVSDTVLPVEPRPRATPEPSPETGPAERAGSTSKAPRVEEAEPAESTKALRQGSEEDLAETQFRNFAATEASTGSTATAQARPATDAAADEDHPTGQATSLQRKTEEAQAAQEFHGLLE